MMCGSSLLGFHDSILFYHPIMSYVPNSIRREFLPRWTVLLGYIFIMISHYYAIGIVFIYTLTIHVV